MSIMEWQCLMFFSGFLKMVMGRESLKHGNKEETKKKHATKKKIKRLSARLNLPLKIREATLAVINKTIF